MSKRTRVAPRAPEIDAPVKKRDPKASISVNAAKFAAITAAAARAGIPKSAVVEIIAARAIGLADTDLPGAVQAWIPRFDETFGAR